jgi:2-C-methyl-D-erythritol 4-phosphate cytidylyltransferase/2-C-methyl-D-erythritol 2,4-cyclodiphosphate synthase
MSISAIIAAAGSGERFGAGIPKALIQLADRTLLEHAISSLAPVVDQIVITAPAGFEKQISELAGEGIVVVTGGATRSVSVRNGLAVATGEYVLVHDAARALASTDVAMRVIAQLQSGEVAVVPAIASGGDATDDAGLIEAAGGKVKVIRGEERAIKITTPADLNTALSHLGLGQDVRTGVGTDAHAFGQGRELWLAGLHWPDEQGVEGHSDGDVAAHAICDALFAATGLGDLGTNFGTDRPEYAGASGTRLMQECAVLVKKEGFAISNVSVQIIGNRPKIGKRRAEAIATISSALGGVQVSVSATTTDGMGLTGEGKGIAAIATALVFKQ